MKVRRDTEKSGGVSGWNFQQGSTTRLPVPAVRRLQREVRKVSDGEGRDAMATWSEQTRHKRLPTLSFCWRWAVLLGESGFDPEPGHRSNPRIKRYTFLNHPSSDQGRQIRPSDVSFVPHREPSRQPPQIVVFRIFDYSQSLIFHDKTRTFPLFSCRFSEGKTIFSIKC